MSIDPKNLLKYLTQLPEIINPNLIEPNHHLQAQRNSQVIMPFTTIASSLSRLHNAGQSAIFGNGKVHLNGQRCALNTSITISHKICCYFFSAFFCVFFFFWPAAALKCHKRSRQRRRYRKNAEMVTFTWLRVYLHTAMYLRICEVRFVGMSRCHKCWQ